MAKVESLQESPKAAGEPQALVARDADPSPKFPLKWKVFAALCTVGVFLTGFAGVLWVPLWAGLLGAILLVSGLILMASDFEAIYRVSRFIESAQSKEVADRRAAAAGFGWVGRALPPRYARICIVNLITLSADADPRVRSQAANSISMFLPAANPALGRRALERMFLVVGSDEESEVRYAASRALLKHLALLPPELKQQAWEAIPRRLSDPDPAVVTMWLGEMPALGKGPLGEAPGIAPVLARLLRSKDEALAFMARRALLGAIDSFPSEDRQALLDAALSPALAPDQNLAAQALWDMRPFAQAVSHEEAARLADSMVALAASAPEFVAAFALLTVGIFGAAQPARVRAQMVAQILAVDARDREAVTTSRRLAAARLGAGRPLEEPERSALVEASHLLLEALASDDVIQRRWARAALEVAAQVLAAPDQRPVLLQLVALIASPKPIARTGASAAIVDAAAHIAPANQPAVVEGLIGLLAANEEIVQRQAMVTIVGAAPHLAPELVVRAVTALNDVRRKNQGLLRDEAADALMVIRQNVTSKAAA